MKEPKKRQCFQWVNSNIVLRYALCKEGTMAENVEIRWHGRGGQGTVTAAKVFADACLSGGRDVQAFPEYGPERAGAPLRAYNRISDKELRTHCPVQNPGVVVVVDATLLDAIDVTDGALDNAAFIINTRRTRRKFVQNSRQSRPRESSPSMQAPSLLRPSVARCRILR